MTVTKRDGTVWQLEKRYSEFDELNATLRKVDNELMARFLQVVLDIAGIAWQDPIQVEGACRH
jgi:hypothetical protein